MNNAAAADNSLYRWLDTAGKEIPVLGQALRTRGEMSIYSYLKNFAGARTRPIQPRNDLLSVVYNRVRPLLGEDLAQDSRYTLSRQPVVLTANHHEVNYYAQSLQGALLFALKRIIDNSTPPVALIFSCGNVSLNNPTYPRGMLIYGLCNAALGKLPLKIPLLPRRNKMPPHTAPAVTTDRLDAAAKRIKRLYEENSISDSMHRTASKVLDFYREPAVQRCEGYSDQVTLVNHRIFSEMFHRFRIRPQVIYLELERIANALLEADLKNPDSLSHRILFNGQLRNRVLSALEGNRICWDRDLLEERLRKAETLTGKKLRSALLKLNRCGTVFFWGIDASGKRIPLLLREENVGEDPRLWGVDSRGKVHTFSYTADAIAEGLAEKRLFVSLFTAFLAISFARGVACIGGYFQGEYLPAVQKAISDAFRKSGEDALAAGVDSIPAEYYLSGLSVVMSSHAEKIGLLPAGALEILEGNGIDDKKIERIVSMTVRDAHAAGLFDILPDTGMPRHGLPADWRERLAEESRWHLAGRVVVNNGNCPGEAG